jgi:transcriptional regulator with XRE-family HTH domain
MLDKDVASFGENLRRLREQKGLTQDEVARRMGYVNNSQIAAWERNPQRLPDPDNIRKAATAVGVEPWELLEGVETEIDKLRRVRNQIQHMAEAYWAEQGDDTERKAPNAEAERTCAPRWRSARSRRRCASAASCRSNGVQS